MRPTEGGGKKAAGILATLGILIAKFFGALKGLLLPLLKFGAPLWKVGLIALKTGGSMFASIWLYATIGGFGWHIAAGFVILILFHECGHLIAARQLGLRVGAPVFIPFMGAFIALKEAPRDAWVEAWVGIGGPLLGAFASLVCHSLGEMLDKPLLIAIASTGYWLNLFNLCPIGTLDGGRVVTALSPWFWLPGLGVMGWLALTRPNFIIILILIMSLPRVLSLFRAKTEAEQRYFEVPTPKRWLIGILYFGLMAALALGMFVADQQLQSRHPVRRPAQVQSAW